MCALTVDHMGEACHSAQQNRVLHPAISECPLDSGLRVSAIDKVQSEVFALPGVVINAVVKFSFELSTPEAEEHLWFL
ncbi:hypothetical protein STEG23_015082 [Scotinomys teguina]